MIFKPIPEFPGYSISECGVVRRDERLSSAKTGANKGTVLPAKILKKYGRDAAKGRGVVAINGQQLSPHIIAAEVWGRNQWNGWVHYPGYTVRTIQRPPVEGFE